MLFSRAHAHVLIFTKKLNHSNLFMSYFNLNDYVVYIYMIILTNIILFF